MGIEEMPPQIKLVCDTCGQAAGSDSLDRFVWNASDVERALSEAAFHREDDGALICDNCAWERTRCNCPGPKSNATVDGNGGHSPSCPQWAVAKAEYARGEGGSA